MNQMVAKIPAVESTPGSRVRSDDPSSLICSNHPLSLVIFPESIPQHDNRQLPFRANLHLSSKQRLGAVHALDESNLKSLCSRLKKRVSLQRKQIQRMHCRCCVRVSHHHRSQRHSVYPAAPLPHDDDQYHAAVPHDTLSDLALKLSPTPWPEHTSLTTVWLPILPPPLHQYTQVLTCPILSPYHYSSAAAVMMLNVAHPGQSEDDLKWVIYSE